MANKAQVPEASEANEARRSRIVGCAGRGGKGKSWILRTLYEMASSRPGSDVRIVDADPGNRTLFNSVGKRTAVRQPTTTSESDRVKIMRAAIEAASKNVMTVYADLGGNDQTLTQVTGESIDEEMQKAISAFGFPGVEEIDLLAGVDMTILYPVSHDPQDIDQIDAILRSPIAKKDLVIVHNMALLSGSGPSDGDPFEQIKKTELYQEALKAGAKVWTFPALPPRISLDLVRTGTSFYDAVKGGDSLGIDQRTNEVVPALPIFERQSLQLWAGRVVLSSREAGLEGKLG